MVSIASLIWPEPTMRPGDSSNSSPLGGFDLLLGHGDGLANSANKSGNAVIGIALTVLSTLVLAGRLVAEEFALTGTSLHPLQVLGYEGMWGTILVGISLPIVWVIPGSDVGEDLLHLTGAYLSSKMSSMQPILTFIWPGRSKYLHHESLCLVTRYTRGLTKLSSLSWTRDTVHGICRSSWLPKDHPTQCQLR